MASSLLARRAVLTRIAGRALALPVEHVVETMRPLPIEPLAPLASGVAPPCVLGNAQIRGVRMPVIDAARLLGLVGDAAPTRFVVLGAAGPRVALQVDAVIDVRALADGRPIGPVPGLPDLGGLAAALRDARWIEEPAPA